MNAPITCPQTFSATTNIRSGTSSPSEKFQTSFCNATHALSSSSPWQRRITMASALKLASPAALLVATVLQAHPWAHFRGSYPLCAAIVPSIQSGGGICDSFGAARIRDRRKDSVQYSRAQKRDRRLLLPNASATLREHSAVPNQLRRDPQAAVRARGILSSLRVVRLFLR